jgi:hypothetical protein
MHEVAAERRNGLNRLNELASIGEFSLRMRKLKETSSFAA